SPALPAIGQSAGSPAKVQSPASSARGQSPALPARGQSTGSPAKVQSLASSARFHAPAPLQQQYFPRHQAHPLDRGHAQTPEYGLHASQYTPTVGSTHYQTQSTFPPGHVFSNTQSRKTPPPQYPQQYPYGQNFDSTGVYLDTSAIDVPYSKLNGQQFGQHGHTQTPAYGSHASQYAPMVGSTHYQTQSTFPPGHVPSNTQSRKTPPPQYPQQYLNEQSFGFPGSSPDNPAHAVQYSTLNGQHFGQHGGAPIQMSAYGEQYPYPYIHTQRASVLQPSPQARKAQDHTRETHFPSTFEGSPAKTSLPIIPTTAALGLDDKNWIVVSAIFFKWVISRMLRGYAADGRAATVYLGVNIGQLPLQYLRI
ncbi:MAG: hypothetical protein CYPHOPRED_004153, partial [Cyphobasidiales sp. Tagirdzhanova-0007]